MPEKPSFEANMQALQQIVQRLGQGDVPLEEALNQFQRGVEISRELKMTLANAENKLTQVMNDDGTQSNFNRDQGN